MNLNLTTPAKAGLGASAAAGTSLVAAGAGGAFSSGAQLEKVEDNKENLIKEDTNEDNVSDKQQLQNEPKPENQRLVNTIPNIQKVDLEQDLEYFEGEEGLGKTEKLDSSKLRFVSQDTKQKYLPNTVGKTYERFLVAVVGEENDSNATWWGTTYDSYSTAFEEDSETREEDNPFDTNEKVKFGYDKDLSTDSDSLNYLCHQTYQLTKSRLQLQHKVDNDADSISIWEDLWNYCSDAKAEPVFLAEDADNSTITQGSLGFENKNNLLSVKDSKNNFFWKRLNNWFFNQSPEKISDKYFNDFRKTNQKTATDENIPLREKCKEAYSILSNEEVGANKPSKEALLKYCSLND